MTNSEIFIKAHQMARQTVAIVGNYFIAFRLALKKVYAVLKNIVSSPSITTFKNKKFIQNDDCTNIVFCKSETAPDNNWIQCKESEIEEIRCSQLYIQAGVRYYGYL